MRRLALPILLLLALAPLAAMAEQRVALVFGNDRYDSLRRLANAGQDAETIAATLEDLGFEVVIERDRDLRRMRRALDFFAEDFAGADVALVFYAGHGVEIAGDNRLLPTDADPTSADTLRATSLPLEEVRATLSSVAPVLLILIDACREDPFAADASDDGRGVVPLSRPVPDQLAGQVFTGFGRMGAAENTLFAFSAAPGRTAADGTGDNSPFTTALSKYLGTAGVEIRSALTLVQQAVYDSTDGTQLPYIENGLPRLFFAAAAPGPLPEREALLLAMADLSPSLRAEVEAIAADTGVPLAPLYGAVIAGGLQDAAPSTRATALADAAAAYRATAEALQSLAATDPEVEALRARALDQLRLGALDTARALLDEAIARDRASRQDLAANLAARTISEAQSLIARAGVARTQADRTGAMQDYTDAAALIADLPDSAKSPDAFRLTAAAQRAIGQIALTLGETAHAAAAFEASETAARAWHDAAPGADSALALARALSDRADVVRRTGNRLDAITLWAASEEFWLEAMDTAADTETPLREYFATAVSAAEAVASIGHAGVAQENYTAALDLLGELAATGADIRDEQAFLHARIGDLALQTGDRSRAQAEYETALALRQALADARPGDRTARRNLGNAHVRIGNLRGAQGDLAGAEDAFRQGIALLRALLEDDAADTGVQRELSLALQRLALTLAGAGQAGAAADARAEARGIAEALARQDPDNLLWQADFARLLDGEARRSREAGDTDAALADWSASCDIWARLADADIGNRPWRASLADCWRDVGLLLEQIGEEARAITLLEGALDVRERLVADTAPGGEWAADLARWMADLKQLHVRLGYLDPERAEAHLQVALDVARRMDDAGLVTPGDQLTADVLAAALAELQAPEDAPAPGGWDQPTPRNVPPEAKEEPAHEGRRPRR